MQRKIKALNKLSVASLILAAGNVCDKGIFDNSAIALIEKSHRIQAS